MLDDQLGGGGGEKDIPLVLISVCVCVCVCVRERERERQREKERGGERERELCFSVFLLTDAELNVQSAVGSLLMVNSVVQKYLLVVVCNISSSGSSSTINSVDIFSFRRG